MHIKEHTAGEIESWISRRVAELLKISKESVDVNEPFSNYGIDSISAVALWSDLENWLNRQLAASVLYDQPSIRDLAKHLADNK